MAFGFTVPLEALNAAVTHIVVIITVVSGCGLRGSFKLHNLNEVVVVLCLQLESLP